MKWGFMFEKMSTGTGVTDLNIGINGWILFSFLHIRDNRNSETSLIFFNYKIWEINNYD